MHATLNKIPFCLAGFEPGTTSQHTSKFNSGHISGMGKLQAVSGVEEVDKPGLPPLSGSQLNRREGIRLNSSMRAVFTNTLPQTSRFIYGPGYSGLIKKTLNENYEPASTL